MLFDVTKLTTIVRAAETSAGTGRTLQLADAPLVRQTMRDLGGRAEPGMLPFGTNGLTELQAQTNRAVALLRSYR